MPYKVRFTKYAERKAERLHNPGSEDVARVIEGLKQDPRPPQAELKGGEYTIDAGPHEIIYEVVKPANQSEAFVRVLDIGVDALKDPRQTYP